MQKREIVRILDIPVDTKNMQECLDYIDYLLSNNEKGHYIFAVNSRKIIRLQKDPLLRERFGKAAILVPDGIGIVLAVRWLKKKRIERVAGVDLMQNICKKASQKKYKIFIFGAVEEVNRAAVEELKIRYPEINIVGRCNGYLREDMMDDLIYEINKSAADILFVALGSPKQEKWIQEYLPKLNVKLTVGIGGTLETLAGHIKRAPKYVQKLGLEWFYRFLKDPQRIRRHGTLLLFAIRVFKEKISQSR